MFELRLAVVAQSSFSGVSRNKLIRKYQQQPRLLVDYGRQAMLGSGDLQEAKRWFQKALLANPLYVPAWLAMGELLNDEGDSVGANAILDYLDRQMEDVARWRWDKAMLAFLLGRNDILTADLSWLLQQKMVSGKTKEKIVKFAFSLWPDPEELLKNMGEHNSIRLFEYAVKTKNLDSAAFIWPIAEENGIKRNNVLAYINSLIRSFDFRTAAEIWKKYYPSPGLLYNGNFTAPVVGSGFGWQNVEIDGVIPDFTVDKAGNPMLHLYFSGSDNLNFLHINQNIPLPGIHSYTLTGQLQSKGLTTDQRPFIEIVGADCLMRAASSEMVQTEQNWKPFTLTFTVPDECTAIQLRIRRKPSISIDNLIKGDMWLANFSITETKLRPSLIEISPLQIYSGSFDPLRLPEISDF